MRQPLLVPSLLMLMLELQVRSCLLGNLLFHPSIHLILPSSALETQLHALHHAAVTATTAVNARGATVADRLHDIPNHARHIVGHGVHQGALVALAVV